MLNCYAGLDDLTQSFKGGSTAADKAVALRTLEAVSRAVDRGLEWQFFNAVNQTVYYDGNGELVLPLRAAAAVRGGSHAGLLSVSSVTIDENDDGTYEKTVVENTDFWLARRFGDDGPYTALEAMTRSNQISGGWYHAPRSVKVVGETGYSNETESAGTLGAAIADTTTTSVTMTAGHTVQAGNTILIESEYLFISAVGGNVLTVERGVNGSTAATHSNGTAVKRRRYPRPIEMAVVMESARLIRDGMTGFSGQMANSDLAGYAFAAVYPAIRDLKASFHPTGTVVAV